MSEIKHLILIAIFAGLIAACRSNESSLTLINQSGEVITFAKIRLCDQVIETTQLNPDEKFHYSFSVRNDSHYEIEVFFASGKQLKGAVGYVTPGFDYKQTITIKHEEISISEAIVERSK